MRTFAALHRGPRTGAASSSFLHPVAHACRPIGRHDVGRTSLHAASPAAVRTKLRVTDPSDAYERPADQVSQRVVPPSHSLQRCSGNGESCGGHGSEPTGQPERIAASRAGTSQREPAEAPPIVADVLRTEGQPLDPTARAFMEARFGHDFSRVRVHADSRAGDSAQAIDARAYTVGQHVVFGPNQYAPESFEGQRLLAHELTPVVPQTSPAGSVDRAVMRQPKPVETKFKGCQPGQSTQVDAAVQDARRALNAAASVVAGAYGRPDHVSAVNRQLLLDHFHTTD